MEEESGKRATYHYLGPLRAQYGRVGQEKARNVVDAVVRLADLIRQHKSLSAEDREVVK